MTEPALANWSPEDEEAEIVFRRPRPAMIVTILMVALASLGAFQFRDSISPFAVRPFGAYLSKTIPSVNPSATAFGTSGGVLLKFAMPGERIQYPLDVHGDPTGLHYEWIRLGETVPVETARPLGGAEVQAP